MINPTDEDYLNKTVALAFICIGTIGLWLHSRNIPRLGLLKNILPPGFVILHYHLSAASLGILAPFPFVAICALFKRWLFGDFGCQIYAFEGMVAGECLITLACTISYLHMIHYTKYSLSDKLKPVHYQIIASLHWVFGFLISVLPLLGFGRYELEPHKTSCLFSWIQMDKSTYLFMVVLCTIGYALPLSFGLYALSKTMHLVNNEDNNSCTPSTPKLDANFRISTWLNAWILLVICLSWLPFGIIGFQALIFGAPTISINSYYIPQLVAKLGTALLPMAYTGTFKKLKQHARNE